MNSTVSIIVSLISSIFIDFIGAPGIQSSGAQLNNRWSGLTEERDYYAIRNGLSDLMREINLGVHHRNDILPTYELRYYLYSLSRDLSRYLSSPLDASHASQGHVEEVSNILQRLLRLINQFDRNVSATNIQVHFREMRNTIQNMMQMTRQYLGTVRGIHDRQQQELQQLQRREEAGNNHPQWQRTAFVIMPGNQRPTHIAIPLIPERFQD